MNTFIIMSVQKYTHMFGSRSISIRNVVLFSVLVSSSVFLLSVSFEIPYAQAVFPIPPISASPSGQGSFSSWSVSPAISKVVAVTTSDDSQFVYSSTLAQRITYKFSPTIPSGVQINSVTVEGILYKSGVTTGTTCVTPIADQGTNNVKSRTSDCTMGTVGTTISTVYTLNPFNNKVWSASDFSKTNFGFEQATSGKTANLDKIKIIVNISDITPPVVKVPKNIHVRATVHTFGSETAPADFIPAPSATDNIDGPLTPTCAPISGSTFNIGHTKVTCTATDAAGNTGSKKFSVEVEDLLFDNQPTANYPLDGIGIITLRDKDTGDDGDDDLHFKKITVTSKDSTTLAVHGSINLTLPELSPNSGTFVSNGITFTSGPSSNNAATPMLHALEGDLIVVNHDNEITAQAKIMPLGISPLSLAPGGSPPRTTDVVRFYESDVYTPAQGATVKVNDASIPSGTNTVSVLVKASACTGLPGDTVGFSITLNRDGTDPSFTSGTLLTFSPTATDATANALKAPVDCKVLAIYGANTATATIINDVNQVAGPSYTPDNTVRSTCIGDTDLTTDADGICDSWESQSAHPGTLSMPAGWYVDPVTNVASGIAYTLSCNPNAVYSGATGTQVNDPTGATVCPSPTRKDVYVEIDYMTGHMPSSAAINSVVAAFGIAPVRGVPGGPLNGIALHVITDERIAHTNLIAYDTGTPSFLSLKTSYFGTSTERASVAPADVQKLLEAKRQFFHYAMFIHQDTNALSGSGYGDRPGNDIVISLGGGFVGHVGSNDQQAGTLMHELGHNLGLDHGGNNADNCKPNYPSVMNYLFQFDKDNGGYVPARPLDFSRTTYAQIVQSALREDIVSMSGSPARNSTIGGFDGSHPIPVGFTPTVNATGTKIDWNRNGLAAGTYSQNVNYFALGGCDTNTGTPTLTSFSDWTNLVYNFRGSSGMDKGFTTANQFHDDVLEAGTASDETLKPIIDTIEDVTVPEGLFSYDLTIHDPDSLSWDILVNYGDGSEEDNVFFEPDVDGEDDTTIPLSHVYADGPNGPHTVTITVTSNRAAACACGAEASTTFDVTVENVAPVVVAGIDQEINEGETLSLDPATFTDPGTADTHEANIDWGDGDTDSTMDEVTALTLTEPIFGETPSDGTVSGSHVYADNGVYTVTVTVIDDDDVEGSGTGSASFDVTVNAVSLETMFGGVAKGSPTDHGKLVSIDQGDGTQTVVGIAVNSWTSPTAGLSGLAYDGAISTLFGSSIGGGGTTSRLVEINTVDGDLGDTDEPEIGYYYDNGENVSFVPISIGDLAIQPETGTLYGLRSGADGLGGAGELYTIDKITGVATLVGDTGYSGGGGIAFSPDGTLYIIGYTCDDGCGNAVAELGTDDGVSIISIHPVDNFYDGLGISSDGTLFATTTIPDDCGECDYLGAIYTIDPDTGDETFIGSDIRFISDVAFSGTPVNVVPLYGGVARNSASDGGSLVTINQNTGLQTLFPSSSIGEYGGIGGLAIDNVGRLFVTSIPGPSYSSVLIEEDPSDGSIISPIGTVCDNSENCYKIVDLAVNPMTNILYGFAQGDKLVTIDKDTAVATVIGTLDTGAANSGAIAFGPDGTLYMTSAGDSNNNVFKIIDPTDASTITDIGTDHDFSGLAVRSDGVIFGSIALASTGDIYIIDADGTTHFVGTDSRYLGDLDFYHVLF